MPPLSSDRDGGCQGFDDSVCPETLVRDRSRGKVESRTGAFPKYTAFRQEPESIVDELVVLRPYSGKAALLVGRIVECLILVVLGQTFLLGYF